MKVTINEYNGCFEISLEPENMEEQSKLIRLGMNRTKVLKSLSTNVWQDLKTNTHIVVGKSKMSSSTIRSRK